MKVLFLPEIERYFFELTEILYGKKMLHSVFPKSKATQWYVFFNVYQESGETVLLIRYISNNHVISQFLEH